MSQPPSILVVEDDVEISEAVCEILRGEGYEAIAAMTLASGREALFRRKPDVVLLDLMLGEESGEVLLEEMAAAELSTPAVLMSASPHALAVAKRYDVALLMKPFELEVLLQMVKDGRRPTRPPA
ncbi:MAG: hypothetical protein NVS3B10_24600 [Polyangiales bacterium]